MISCKTIFDYWRDKAITEKRDLFSDESISEVV